MHDANIRVAIAGAGGRMGRQLIQAALALEGVQLGAKSQLNGGIFYIILWLMHVLQALSDKKII